MRKENLCLTILTPLLIHTGFPGQASAQTNANKSNRPNFIYILLDDMPVNMLPVGENRYPFNVLPNLEKLQKQGVTFSNFFCTHSLSSPSRATNLTGTYSHIHGVTQNSSNVDPNWEIIRPYSYFMQQAGYETAFIGKIHMAHDPAHRGKGSIRPGFDYWVSFYGQGDYINPLIVDNGEEKKFKGYMTDILNEYTLEWIKNKRDKNKPFSLCLWHKAVHQPFTPAERHRDLYEGEIISPPDFDTHLDDLLGKPLWQRARKVGRNTDIPDFIKPPKWTPRSSQMSMLRGLRSVDESLGDIMQLLEQEGIAHNTVIIFSSDNGYLHGEHQFGDKRMAYEVSMKIPMVIYYPQNGQRNKRLNDLCLNLDVAPTILDIAGIGIPGQMQGKSMKKLITEGRDKRWREAVFLQYFLDSGMESNQLLGPDYVCVRTHDFKYVDNYYLNNTDIDELYDLRNDPGEMKNLINDPSYKKILNKMKTELSSLMEKYKYNPDRLWRYNQIMQQLGE